MDLERVKSLYCICFRGEENNNSLWFPIEETKVPIVYSDIYNISFWGLERIHPFDSGKWGRIVDMLQGEVKLC